MVLGSFEELGNHIVDSRFSGSRACLNILLFFDYILIEMFEDVSVGIQSPSENGFMEPKYLAFRR